MIIHYAGRIAQMYYGRRKPQGHQNRWALRNQWADVFDIGCEQRQALFPREMFQREVPLGNQRF